MMKLQSNSHCHTGRTRLQGNTVTNRCFALLPLVVLLALPAKPVGAVMLYNGTQGELPAAQGWAYGTDPLFGAQATQTYEAAGFTILDTTVATGEKAGYFTEVPIFGKIHPDVPTLDRTAGYTLLFDVRLDAENHNTDNRAGFSVIALGNDNQGIELAFWTDEVWAQSDSFAHAEGAAYNTTTAVTQYALAVAGDGYTLAADGADVLSGALRDYPVSAHEIYGYSDFLFFGDDTSSADARIELARIEVLTGTAVPEPASLLLIVLCGLLIAVVRRRFPRSK